MARTSEPQDHRSEPEEAEDIDREVERMTAGLMAQAAEVLANDRLSAVDKLNGFFAMAGSFKVERASELRELMRVIYRPENEILRHRIMAAAGRTARPLLAAILVQGVDEGAFDCPQPGWTAGAILHIGALMSDTVAARVAAVGGEPTAMTTADVAVIEEEMELYADAIRRLLGARPGSIHLTEPGLVAAICGVE